MCKLKTVIKNIPIVGPILQRIFGKKAIGNEDFPGSKNYWEHRYSKGGNSGAGSYNNLAEFKAEVLNAFVSNNEIQSVVEFGCGDGNQLSLAKYPDYVGVDVSKTILTLCEEKFKNDFSKKFLFSEPENIQGLQADLVLSLDVLFHLIEDEVFETYMYQLFNSAKQAVIIYSSNFDKEQTFHEKDRKFTAWIDNYIDGWKLTDHIPNRFPFDSNNPNHTSKADFFIYLKEE